MRWAWLIPLVLVLAVGCTQTAPPSVDELPSLDEAEAGEIAVLAEDLDTVWEIAFSPEERVFLTEREGTIRVVEDGEVELWREMPETVEQGESGLMGLALHPSFPQQPYVYACQTHRDEEGDLRNRVVRILETDEGPGEPEVIVEGIDAGSIHDGCRLMFDEEGLLYVTMGDASDFERAQDEASRNGKVLRYTAEGQPAGGNEQAGWHPAVFTMGHRNPQGIDLHPDTGTIYVSEHGPENHDEVNVLHQGANYGWPEVRGTDDGGGRYEPAIWTSGEAETIAPAGAAFVDAPESPLHGALLVATLAEAELHVFEIEGEADGEARIADEHELFEGDFGRLRAAVWGPDEALYLTTSNEDGRGTAGPNDDRILRVPLSVLEEQTG